jgi:hypothetical protein
MLAWNTEGSAFKFWLMLKFSSSKLYYDLKSSLVNIVGSSCLSNCSAYTIYTLLQYLQAGSLLQYLFSFFAFFIIGKIFYFLILLPLM